MKLRFWSVRGSIPSPGPQTMRYGGNTTCLEVRSDNDSLVILDAGTGIFPPGQELLKQLPVRANVFMTHTHWDHIQGLPFFAPLYIPGSSVRIHGGYDVVAGRGIDQIIDLRQAQLDAALAGLDVLIGDSSYTAAEYSTRIGWGHGTLEGNMAWAIRLGVKKLVCTHHEPTRSDDDLERAFAVALEGSGRARSGVGEPEILLAREGLELVL